MPFNINDLINNHTDRLIKVFESEITHIRQRTSKLNQIARLTGFSDWPDLRNHAASDDFAIYDRIINEYFILEPFYGFGQVLEDMLVANYHDPHIERTYRLVSLFCYVQMAGYFKYYREILLFRVDTSKETRPIFMLGYDLRQYSKIHLINQIVQTMTIDLGTLPERLFNHEDIDLRWPFFSDALQFDQEVFRERDKSISLLTALSNEFKENKTSEIDLDFYLLFQPDESLDPEFHYLDYYGDGYVAKVRGLEDGQFVVTEFRTFTPEAQYNKGDQETFKKWCNSNSIIANFK